MQILKVLNTFLILSLSSHNYFVCADVELRGDAGGRSTENDANIGNSRYSQHEVQQEVPQQKMHHPPLPQQPPIPPSSHQQQQQQQQHQQQLHHHHPHIPQHQQYSSHGGGAGGNLHPSHAAAMANIPPHQQQHALYHAQQSSGHAEHKNSYNLLSEAMSQAVSNEFSSLGSGSADGACHADDIDCFSVQDRLGMEAIRTLHKQLDDDDNGNIDLSESDDFLREELKYNSGYEKRQKAFHFNDDMHISVKELWEAWLRSEVHNWTIEQTTDWLAQSVQLPQYVELFKQHKVSGASLPRLAVNNMHYVGTVLGIKDPIHKQKIALKAMDVVLFGPPRETGTRWKDYILVTLLLSAIIGCWYAYQQNKHAKRHLRRMAQDMEGLQRAEQSLQEMQKELERARMEQENVATEKMDLERRLKEVPTLSSSSSDLEVQQLKKEIEMLRTELSRAEIELVDNCWAPPAQLQSWLQYTYELENKSHLRKRISAEKQLQSAREACEKLRKKRTSLVGAFVSTHGKSIDDVDRSIVEARNSLSEVTNELQERLHRWKQIEQCLGMNIVNNNGLSYLESVLYSRNGGGGGGSSIKSSRGRITSSSDDLDDESVQGLMDGYSRASGLSGSAMLNSHIGREDSSGSEDNNIDTQSVQFYLGNAPSAVINSAALTPRTPSVHQQHSPMETMNHVANNNNHLPSTTATAAAVTTSHSNNNDSNFVAYDGSRHSPSASSERSDRSIAVPPRTKKHNHNNSSTTSITASTTTISHTSVPPPPPPVGAIGRAPLPPPRKTNPSPLLRSQSSDLMAVKDLHTLLARPQSTTIQNSAALQSLIKTGSGSGNIPSPLSQSKSKKMMVKQHSTASQQSTSSTSSSVQSAPEQSAIKQQSPSRFSTSSLERHIMPHQQHHQHLPQYQQQQQQHAAFISALPAHLDRGNVLLSSSNTTTTHPTHPHYTIGTAADDILTKTEANIIAAAIDSCDSLTQSTENLSSTVKKRKKGLRFGFGSKKTHSETNAKTKQS